ncbi:hypothetical protein MTR_4g026600 [Medicago truncatula]|uniref:Uncharacterized protein n=1 Tax=Medicago truncatula TaxID=3880 RepID=G7JH01_MEDTR|nr:hypothetical protein MTR_4g026600 [Medicago truncatula]
MFILVFSYTHFHLLFATYLHFHFVVPTQAQKKAPPNKHCIDKFLIQSIVAWPGATAKDISEMFEKKSGNEVKDFELKKQISCSLQLSNKSDNHMVLRIR